MSIPLSRGKFAVVDEADTADILQYKWSYATKGYAFRQAKVGGKRTSILMHRVIANPPMGMVVDHINKDKLDNRRSNLRVCTQAENCRNSDKPGQGVSWNKGKGKWVAGIKYNYRRIFLGYFVSRDDARKAYLEARNKYFGDFA